MDAAGNRTQQIQHALPGSSTSTTTNYIPGVTGHAHALASTSTTGGTTASTSYTYNSDGSTNTRVLASGTQTLSYTEEGRTAAVTTAGGSVSYLYGADCDQLIRRDPTTSTLYLPGEELTRNNSTGAVTGTRYYSFNSAVVSMRTGHGNPQYLYSDLHGSAQVAVPTTTTGTATPIRRYLDPYGNPLGVITGGAWPDQHAFLGKPKDATSGLSDLGAREYDSALGRFLSVDPLLDPANPLQSNGYSYAGNNPVTFSDPTGLMQACEGPCHGSTRGGSAPTGLASPPAASNTSQCSAANGGDAAACNVGAGGDGGYTGGGGGYTDGSSTSDSAAPACKGVRCGSSHTVSGAGDYHQVCDGIHCAIVPSDQWTVPGDDWVLKEAVDHPNCAKGDFRTQLDGRTVFLESGNNQAGLMHIMAVHGRQFLQAGVSEAQVPDLVIQAATRGRVVGAQSESRLVCATYFNDRAFAVAITIGDNGFIVGANLASRP